MKTGKIPDRAKSDEQWQECLLRVAKYRDKEAFSELFDHFVPLIRAYSLNRQPGATLLADELAQDVILKVWSRANTYNSNLGRVSTWIFTLARNCWIDQIRRNRRYGAELNPEDIYADVDGEHLDPFQITQQKQLEHTVREKLAELPVEQAQVLGKLFLEGKTQSETSAEIGIPLGTVKSRTRLALQKLELLLKR